MGRGVEGVELPVEEEVEGVGLSVGEGVEGVELPIREGVDSWLSSSIFSFNLFMYVLCDFLPRSCLLGSFVTTFCSVLSMFNLGYKKKKKKDPIFEHPVFDLVREKVKRAMEQLKKSQETF